MAQPEMVQRLKRVARLSMLDDKVLADLALVVSVERHSPGDVICEQGKFGTRFYAIELGQVLVSAEVEGQKVEVTRLSEGDAFGERALIEDLPRTATIVAETTVDLLGLERKDYQDLLRKHPSLKGLTVGPETSPLLKQVTLFSRLLEKELSDLGGYGGMIFYPPGRRVVKQGDVGMTMYAVSKGELVAYRTDERGQRRPVKVLKPGDAFGETSLLVGETRDATVMTREYTELWYINQASFARFLQAHPDIQARLKAREEVRRKQKAGAFPDQKPGEIAEILDSKHWLAFVRTLWQPALLLGLMGAVLVVTNLLWLGSPSEVGGVDVLPVVLTILWMLAMAGVFAWHWVDWQNDYHIVTTQRVIHIENELFRTISRDEVPIEQVQSVGIEQDLWGEVLGYGHVRITTAGAAGGLMELEFVHDPEEFQRVIFEQMGRAKYRVVAAEQAELRHAIRQAMRLGLLEEEVKEAPPSPRATRRSWVALLTENRLARRLRKTMTESGVATFLRRPHLPRQEFYENDRVIWRKHWGILLLVTYRPLLLSWAVLALLLGAGAGRLGWFFVADIPPSWFDGLLVILGLIALPVLGWLIWEVEDWRNDLYIVTDTHIIDIKRRPLFLEERRRQAELDDIQNMNASIQGFWAGRLKFGDVKIETAGEGAFEFKQVRNPNKLLAEIEKRRKAYNARLRQQEVKQRQAEMARWFAAYHDEARELEARARRRHEQSRPADWTKDSEGEAEEGQEV